MNVHRTLWLPVAALAALLVVGVILRIPASFEQPGLLTVLNLIFLTALPGTVAILAIPAYRATGVAAIAIIGAAMAATALGAGLLPPVLLQTLGANALLTMHNTAVLVAGLLVVASAVGTVLGYGPVRARMRDVAALYGATMAFLALILIGILAGTVPPFLLPGSGFTPLRETVLGFAVIAFGAATLIWWQIAARSLRVRFLRWYVPALALYGIGLLAILAQHQVGGLVGWTGRAAQYLAGVYFFGAIWAVWSRKGSPREAARHLGMDLLQASLPYREVVDAASDGVVALSADGTILYWNDAVDRLLGLGGEDVGGISFAGRFLSPEEQATAEGSSFLAALTASSPAPATHQLCLSIDAPAAGRLPAELTVAVVRGGRIRVISMRDIRDRLEAFVSLEASEVRYRTLVEESTDAIFVLDPEGRIAEVNRAGEELLGEASGALIGRPWVELIAPDDLAANPLHLDELRGDRTLRFERELRDASGAAIPVELSAKMLPDGRFLEIGRDIRARKTAEAALRRTTELLEATEAVAHVGGWELDLATETLYWTDETYRIHDLTPAEYTPSVATAIDWYAPESRPVIAAAVEAAARDGTPFDLELELVTATARRIWVRSTGAVTTDEGRTVKLTGAFQDISARKAAENERARLFAAIDHAPDPLVLFAADARIVYANQALETVTGYEWKALIGSPLAIFGNQESTTRPSGVWESIIAGRPWTGEIPGIRADGATFVLEWSIAPVHDDAGALLGYIGSARDRSAEKALEAQLAQAQRLEAVGELAGGIAHDFNNLLTAIRGYAELIGGGMSPDDPARADVEQVIGAADRAAALTRGLLAFSRRQVLAPRVVDPAEIVSGLVPLLRRLLGEHIELAAPVRPGHGSIRVDPSKLEQVIVNLAVNARDAMPGGGALTIELRDVELDAAYAGSHAEATAGPHVLLAVSDTGIGMDAATQAHIFEPFFTTKGPGKGTGMGLAVVYGIVKQSGGSIYVYSEPGHGSSFKIYFPRVAAQPDPLPAPALPAAPAGAGETILLVEDEAAVRGFAARTLTAAGYRVLAVGSGATALELAAAHGRPIDLLVTDVVMPGMQGHQLAEQLTRARPGLRVLYVSGFTENSVIHHGVAAEGVAFLAKPFNAGELTTAARAALDRPAS